MNPIPIRRAIPEIHRRAFFPIASRLTSAAVCRKAYPGINKEGQQGENVLVCGRAESYQHVLS